LWGRWELEKCCIDGYSLSWGMTWSMWTIRWYCNAKIASTECLHLPETNHEIYPRQDNGST
jgi:hypothetical protein